LAGDRQAVGQAKARGRARGRAFIGISGYDYKPWRGRFYPEDLPARRWLEFASRRFNSIELNGTFYSLKSPAVFERWVADEPGWELCAPRHFSLVCFRRVGSDAHVARPMITACPRVRSRKWAMSSGTCHGSVPSRPMIPVGVWAQTSARLTRPPGP